MSDNIVLENLAEVFPKFQGELNNTKLDQVKLKNIKSYGDSKEEISPTREIPIYQQNDALRRGASIIQAAMYGLLKSKPAYSSFFEVYLDITEGDREAAKPVCLDKLVKLIDKRNEQIIKYYNEISAFKEGLNINLNKNNKDILKGYGKLEIESRRLKIEKELLKKLIAQVKTLEKFWTNYSAYISKLWEGNLGDSDDNEVIKHNIKTVENVTSALIGELIQQGYVRNGTQLKTNEQLHNKFMGRNSYYAAYEIPSFPIKESNSPLNKAFHIYQPIETLPDYEKSRLDTCSQVEEEKEENSKKPNRPIYPELNKLSLDNQKKLITRVSPSGLADRPGLGNTALIINGYADDKGSKKVSSLRLHHRTFSAYQMLSEKLRLKTTRANIEQWLQEVIQARYNLGLLKLDEKAKQFDFKVAMTSLMSPLAWPFNLFFDEHNETQQVEEIWKAIKQVNEKPIEINLKKSDGTIIKTKVKPDINFVVIPVNQGRFAASSMVSEINKSAFKKFADEARGKIDTMDDDDKKSEYRKYYNFFASLYEQFRIKNYSEELNHFLPAARMLLADKLGMQSDIFCKDSWDRTNTVEILSAAIEQFLISEGRLPKLVKDEKNKGLMEIEPADKEKLQEIENHVHAKSIFSHIRKLNVPGDVGMRRHVENHGLVTFLTGLPYKLFPEPIFGLFVGLFCRGKNFNDRHKHISDVEPRNEISKMSEKSYKKFRSTDNDGFFKGIFNDIKNFIRNIKKLPAKIKSFIKGSPYTPEWEKIVERGKVSEQESIQNPAMKQTTSNRNDGVAPNSSQSSLTASTPTTSTFQNIEIAPSVPNP